MKKVNRAVVKHWNCLVRKYGLYGITFPELLSLLIIFMYELLLLVCKIRLLCLFLLSLVILNPSGPIYIEINKPRTIFCSILYEGLFYNWNVMFKNSSARQVPYNHDITITSASLVISITTEDTTIIGFECVGILYIRPTTILISRTINVTIYGMLILLKTYTK